MDNRFHSNVEFLINHNLGLRFDTKEIDARWISEGLSVNDISLMSTTDPTTIFKKNQQLRWKTGPEPVLINAPTGSGKSTFVLEQLAADAANNTFVDLEGVSHAAPMHVLILSNRISLMIQQRKEMQARLDIAPSPIDQLRKQPSFDNIVALSYQSFMSDFNSDFLNSFQFKYVVLDEAHFFCSDAPFNSMTEEILCTILSCYGNAQRIYMTATAYFVKPIIAAYERIHLAMRTTNPQLKSFNNVSDQYFIREYRFPSNTNNLSAHFFYNWSDIITLIKNEQIEESQLNKWLIFVSSKDQGQEIKNELGKRVAEYIDADSPSRNELERDLIINEKFASKALISTTVLYNGVNFKDDALTRIVIDFSDESTLLQMIGRKRLSLGEHLDVYIRIPDSKTVRNRRDNANHLLALLTSAKYNPYYIGSQWGNLKMNEQKLFLPKYLNPYYPSQGLIYEYNYIAQYQLERISGFYERIGSKMKHDEYTYPKEVCAWLNKTFDSSMVITSTDASQQVTQPKEIVVHDAVQADRHSECAKALTEICEKILNGQDSITTDEETRKNLVSALHDCCQSHGFTQSFYNFRSGLVRTKKNIINILTAFNLPYELEDKTKQNKGDLRFYRVTDKSK